MALADTSDMAAAARASGSSFYNAMRILPRAQREAMFEIYSFCRQVDDIADSSGPRGERREQLERWRADIDGLYVNKLSPRTLGLAVAVREFRLRREDFHAVIDGMAMDVTGDIRAPDWAILDLYCDRVASAVGRLSTKIFGIEDGPGTALAHHLGRALQLTNILRDLDEDAALGRLYLPREALLAAGIGGFAMATAPAIVRFVGGSVPDALATTRRMHEITLGENPRWSVPALEFQGVPSGIDVSRVCRTGILPQINTGMAGRVAGTGQVGAGLVTPPAECFPAALAALAAAVAR